MTTRTEFLLVGPVDGQWVGCDLGVVQFGLNQYVKIIFGGRQIFLYGARGRLAWALRACADMLDGREPAPLVSAGDDQVSSSVTKLVSAGGDISDQAVTNMTPTQVAEYFRRSSDLAIMADDVAEALAGQIAGDQVSQDVAAVLAMCDLADLTDDRGAIRGAQSRIAECLGVPNAGSYRPRIQAVIAQLVARRNSTTTGQNPQKHQISA